MLSLCSCAGTGPRELSRQSAIPLLYKGDLAHAGCLSINTSLCSLMPSPSDDKRQRVAVITGSSSGIGFETALTLARNGFVVYATMRDLSKANNLQSIAE